MSPMEEVIEVPPMYEFEVPQDIVGLLIGRKGITIKCIQESSGAHIVIREHYLDNKRKICSIEGKRDEINRCLRMIRRKFPPSRFPDLKLTPLLPMPLLRTYPHVMEKVVQLGLPEGVTFEVVVSAIVSPADFFLQQPTHPTFTSLARQDQFIMAVYGQPIGIPELPRPIEADVICVAPVMGSWFRAQVVTVFVETDEVTVKFLDYGGYARVPASELRQIRTDFMSLPFQATEVYLAGVRPAGDVWSVEAMTYFETLVAGKLISAEVVGTARDGYPVVDLYTSVASENSPKVSDMLIQQGYGVAVETM